MKIYTYKKCSSCQNAIKFLKKHQIEFIEMPIRETPPSEADCLKLLESLDNEKEAFNVSGQDYRSLGLKDKINNLSTIQKAKLLSSNGNLIKRPVVFNENDCWVGFNEDTWKQNLAIF